jgi:hypothetical protein
MSTSTSKPKYAVRVDNVYFLSRIGLSLRWATQGIARRDLSADIRQLLARLDDIEAGETAARAEAQPAASDNAQG